MRAALLVCSFLSFSLIAGCGGNSNNTTTTSGPASTTTTLSVTPSPAVAGANITLTATVASTSATPSGSVTFLDGSTSLGTATLANGTAAFTSTSLAAGTHSLTASFAATTSFGASTSSAVSLSVTAAAPATTALALTASPNPAAAGAAVTLTASLSSTAGVPSGSITFLDGTSTLGTATLANGMAVFTTSSLSAGATHNLTATFAATSTYAAATSAAVALVVKPAPSATTATALTATPNPVAARAPVVLAATVTTASGTPTGSVSFFDGSMGIGSATLANGTASLTVSTLAVSTTHTITAVYAGNSSFATSTSSGLSLVVNAPVAAPTTTTLAASPNPVGIGLPLTLTATITSASSTPEGSVAFYDGLTLLGSSPVTAAMAANTATAVYTTSSLALGTHSLTATLAADPYFSTSTSAPVSLVVSPINANATLSFATPHQTILGFGGAEAFYATYLDSHPNESQIMNALFDPVNGLGITFLRLQNNYYNYNGTNLATFDPDNLKVMTAATAALGAKPSLLMSSWTPPASLKSNNSINGCTGTTNGNCSSGFGTLAQVNGAYNYAGFGQFWLNSLQAYAAQGVVPNYISIQNEPDYPATYVACLFNPTEAPASLYGTSQTYASYGKAFDATYMAINASGALTSVPQMIGPEAFSISNVQPLLTEVPASELAVVAHHLYNVSSYSGNPAGQVTPMMTLDTEYPTSLKFETEYFQTPGFLNAIDIHNALTKAEDNVYLYWGLAWPSTLTSGVASDQQGLLYIDNPFASQSTWAFPSGWTYNDAYYTLKHYSYFIRPGYIRYDAAVDNTDEDISVYQSPDAKTTVIVVLNTSTTKTDTLGLNLSSFTYSQSAMYRSSFATPITSPNAERWASLGAYTTNGITLPPQSEATIVLTK